jgi:hypothetical protein
MQIVINQFSIDRSRDLIDPVSEQKTPIKNRDFSFIFREITPIDVDYPAHQHPPYSSLS